MHGSKMAEEIAAQPGLVRERSALWAQEAAAILGRLEKRRHLAVVGRGSSGNACTFAAYIYAERSGRHAIEFRPWVSLHPNPEASWDDTTVFAYSASGESTDICHAAAWLRERQAQVVSITNAAEANSPLGRVSDASFCLGLGPELAVPATKTFCGQLLASAALTGYALAEQSEQIAGCMERVLAEPLAQRLADFLAGGRMVIWVARGPVLAAGLDLALKLQETVCMPSAAYSSAEFLHGPIAAASAADRVVLLVDGRTSSASLQAVRVHLLARKIPFLVVAGERVDGLASELALRLPLPEQRWARTPLFAMLGQQAALELAIRAGLDPDSPPGLHKVTQTLE